MSASDSLLALRRAGPGDVAALAPLFDAYRQFYDQPADLALAARYLAQRLEQEQSVVFVAERLGPADAASAPAPPPRGVALGFCQLYPAWCSVEAAPYCVLYDLYVDPAARGGGIGRQLMLAAQAHARAAGAVRLDLNTARDNLRAQALYEALGWLRDEVFLSYSVRLRSQAPDGPCR